MRTCGRVPAIDPEGDVGGEVGAVSHAATARGLRLASGRSARDSRRTGDFAGGAGGSGSRGSSAEAPHKPAWSKPASSRMLAQVALSAADDAGAEAEVATGAAEEAKENDRCCLLDSAAPRPDEAVAAAVHACKGGGAGDSVGVGWRSGAELKMRCRVLPSSAATNGHGGLEDKAVVAAAAVAAAAGRSSVPGDRADATVGFVLGACPSPTAAALADSQLGQPPSANGHAASGKGVTGEAAQAERRRWAERAHEGTRDARRFDAARIAARAVDPTATGPLPSNPKHEECE
jgi:hypothetical protein